MDEKELLSEISKRNSKLKLIMGLIIILIVIVSVGLLLLYRYYPEEEELEVEELVLVPRNQTKWCIDNRENYISCKGFQKMSRDYCENAYNQMDSSVENISEDKNTCLFYVELFDKFERGAHEECGQIVDMEGYDEYGGWQALYCYVLTADSREVCRTVGDFPDEESYPGEQEDVCNIFFDYLENVENEAFQELDQDSKDVLILLKAIKTKNSILCDEISLSGSKHNPELRRMNCRILAGDPGAQEESFCEPLIEYCLNPNLYNFTNITTS
ncbi:hypothetical protein KY331_01905 [Candidatus Woesearchaeota archaeon]|nr:hypothetical protein [Candidatus Woesearchaeota archaeon]